MAEVKDVTMKEAPAEDQDGTSGGDESSEQQQKPTKKDKDLLTVEGCVVIQLETVISMPGVGFRYPGADTTN